MLPEPSFDELIRQVEAGDDQAAARLVRDFEPVVRRVLRARLRDARATTSPSIPRWRIRYKPDNPRRSTCPNGEVKRKRSYSRPFSSLDCRHLFHSAHVEP